MGKIIAYAQYRSLRCKRASSEARLLVLPGIGRPTDSGFTYPTFSVIFMPFPQRTLEEHRMRRDHPFSRPAFTLADLVAALSPKTEFPRRISGSEAQQ